MVYLGQMSGFFLWFESKALQITAQKMALWIANLNLEVCTWFFCPYKIYIATT
jgi:hypothetical protein